MESQEQTPKILDQVRNLMRLNHYSIHTERSYLDWIKRCIVFHHMRCREDLAGGEAKIEAFLTRLAIDGKVAASTQNQAMNALVFLYRQVLEIGLDQRIDAVRAERKVNVPVVLDREEVAKVLARQVRPRPHTSVSELTEPRRSGQVRWLSKATGGSKARSRYECRGKYLCAALDMDCR